MPCRTSVSSARLLALLSLSALLAGSCARAPEPKPAPEPAAARDEGEDTDQALFNETVLYVVADGLAYRTPDEQGEASMRIAVDDRFRILEERPGWYRVETEWAEVPAWVPAAAVRTAVEPAPVHVVNERLANQP